MGIPEYTLVVGVDNKHLRQLSWTWPTWVKHKPDFLNRPMLVIYDGSQVKEDDISRVLGRADVDFLDWDACCTTKYEGDPKNKWTNPQRAKMLSGFVYGASLRVTTPCWLKLDTDVVAVDSPDWIDENWFKDDPAIVAHPWAFTKPPDQILKLDQWVFDNSVHLPNLMDKPPLNLCPAPGSDRVGHKRIISWCAFFQTTFTKKCALWSHRTCNWGHLPVPSQDGYMWYCAKRLGLPIIRSQMKKRGWEHWMTRGNIIKHSQKAMDDV
jgi:hypothetical protein